MTREQAAVVLEQFLWDGTDENVSPSDLKYAAEMALAALRGPQPDPGTGLVACGCGALPVFSQFNDGFLNLERVECECGAELTSVPGFCKPAWNRAMGYRG